MGQTIRADGGRGVIRMNFLMTSKGRRTGILFVAALVLVYGFVEHHFVQIQAANAQSATTSPALAMTSGTVAQQIQDEIIAGLGNIAVDQIAFFPLQGNDVGVYATVNLGYGTGPLTTIEMSTIRQDINAWFADVYGQNLPVADAEVYFDQDGRTVAGAGLGIDAYRAMASKASGGTGRGIANVLAQGKQVTGEGVNESWISTEPSS